MKPKELAARLHGMDLNDFPTELNATARRAGLVAVIGVSADTVELYGAITDEIDIPGGGVIYFDVNGILPAADDIDLSCAEYKRAYYDRKKFASTIDAEWNRDGFSWTFTMVPPHSRFVVNRDGVRYCRGIIFDLKELHLQG